MTDEPPYDDDELAEAARLARALDAGHERERGAEHGVGDALEAAEVVGLLKAPALDAQRQDAVLSKIERSLQAARRRTRRRTALASGLGTLALAASALLMVLTRHAQAPSSPPSLAPRAEAPQSAAAAPSAISAVSALRASQLAWLDAPSPETDAALERALGAYRTEQLAELERRYAR